MRLLCSLRTGSSAIYVFLLQFCFCTLLSGQLETVQLGMGNNEGITVTASDSNGQSAPAVTTAQDGFLPNLTAASRFLSQATLGYNMEDIEALALLGIEDWIDQEFQKSIGFTMLEKVIEYHEFRKAGLNDSGASSSIRFWDYAWWQYHMSSDDALRQRIAFALSEFFVISRESNFRNKSYAFGDYYDILLSNAFGNFRDILQEVTFHATMADYLTYLNNPKADPSKNTFPDENYARELLQLFTIGLYELNLDGTYMLDSNGDPIDTYDSDDITEFSKIFTGLTWGDRTTFGRAAPLHDSSYVTPLAMWNTYHEPGTKDLLSGFQVPNRNPEDGDADITDALDNVFNHPNVGPFFCRFMIQRLVTSNPSPEYIERVATKFNDNGSGVRGDLKAVISAILLDPVAKSCDSANDVTFGMLREPFIRYVQMNKAFDNSTMNGNHRNDMYWVQNFVEQKPNTSPSVFNFFQRDYQPIGSISQQNLVAPEFQITNSKTITGYINGLYQWIIEGNPADEFDLYSGEVNSTYSDEYSSWDISDEVLLADDNQLHILVDRLNLILAQGRLSSHTEDIIINTLKEFPSATTDNKVLRARLAMYFVLSSPEYLINR